MKWLILLGIVGSGLAGGWISYRLNWAPLLKSLEADLRARAQPKGSPGDQQNEGGG